MVKAQKKVYTLDRGIKIEIEFGRSLRNRVYCFVRSLPFLNMLCVYLGLWLEGTIDVPPPHSSGGASPPIHGLWLQTTSGGFGLTVRFQYQDINSTTSPAYAFVLGNQVGWSVGWSDGAACLVIWGNPHRPSVRRCLPALLPGSFCSSYYQ